MINGKNIAPLPSKPPPAVLMPSQDMMPLSKQGADVIPSLAAQRAGSPDKHGRDSQTLESLFLIKKWKIPSLGRCRHVFSRHFEVQSRLDLTHFCWRPPVWLWFGEETPSVV